jgi:hypothetical protein
METHSKGKLVGDFTRISFGRVWYTAHCHCCHAALDIKLTMKPCIERSYIQHIARVLFVPSGAACSQVMLPVLFLTSMYRTE